MNRQNTTVKGDDDVVEIKEDSSALKRRMIAVPEVIYLVNQYASASQATMATDDIRHHERIASNVSCSCNCEN
jgi:hypothetical protein